MCYLWPAVVNDKPIFFNVRRIMTQSTGFAKHVVDKIPGSASKTEIAVVLQPFMKIKHISFIL